MPPKLIKIYHQYNIGHRRYVDYIGDRLIDMDCDVLLVITSRGIMSNVGRWRIKLKK